MSDINGAQKEVLKSKTKDVAQPIAGPIVAQDFAQLEVTGGPSTGLGAFLAIKLGDENITSNTTAGFTAAQETTAAVAAFQAAINLAFGAGKITVSATGATTILVQTNDGTALNLTDSGSSDATTDISVTAGTHIQNAMLHEVTAAGTGFPNIGSDGFTLKWTSKDDSSSPTCVIRAAVKNLTGAPVTARWQVWWFIPFLGWDIDQEVGTRSVVCPAGDVQLDTIACGAPGATQIAVVLFDGDGAGGPLPADTAFSAWGTVAG